VKVGDLGKETEVGGRSNKILEKRSGENLQLKETGREEREAKQIVDDQEENLVNMEVTKAAMDVDLEGKEKTEAAGVETYEAGANVPSDGHQFENNKMRGTIRRISGSSREAGFMCTCIKEKKRAFEEEVFELQEEQKRMRIELPEVFVGEAKNNFSMAGLLKQSRQEK
jgi:hypothetical protein